MAKEILATIRESVDELEEHFTKIEEENNTLQKDVAELEDEIEEAEESLNKIKSIQDIKWIADNLQDQQTMEVLKNVIEKHGSLAVMLHLEKLK